MSVNYMIDLYTCYFSMGFLSKVMEFRRPARRLELVAYLGNCVL